LGRVIVILGSREMVVRSHWTGCDDLLLSVLVIARQIVGNACQIGCDAGSMTCDEIGGRQQLAYFSWSAARMRTSAIVRLGQCTLRRVLPRWHRCGEEPRAPGHQLHRHHDVRSAKCKRPPLRRQEPSKLPGEVVSDLAGCALCSELSPKSEGARSGQTYGSRQGIAPFTGGERVEVASVSQFEAALEAMVRFRDDADLDGRAAMTHSDANDPCEPHTEHYLRLPVLADRKSLIFAGKIVLYQVRGRLGAGSRTD
jgi:hypothetical protein